MSLLALKPKRVWAMSDLDKQEGLQLGLHLLYNLSRNTTSFHMTRSIHIEYPDLPKDLAKSVLTLTSKEKKQVRALLKKGKI